jgi:peptide/nickel transport system substrate-binding protein
MALAAIIVLALCAQACTAPPAAAMPARILRIGFGLPSGDAGRSGVRQAARLLSVEGLISFSRSGRPQPWLADRWDLSDDGRTLTVYLKSGIHFHDGRALDAATVRDALQAQLPSYMGPAFGDVSAITVASPQSLTIQMARRSNFVLESLDAGLTSPDSPDAGTGPFRLAEPGADDILALEANEDYRDGSPAIPRVEFHAYQSERAAWANMLRGDVDMLYEVNAEALRSLEPSSQVAVYSHPRNYAYVLLMNVQRPELGDRQGRRQLNDAIDRRLLVEETMNGHGRPVDSPVPREHWAATQDGDAPRFTYQPTRLATPRALTCIFADPSLERMAMAVQRQLRQIGVELTLERIPLDQLYARAADGQFDLLLADMIAGPTMARQQWFFGSGGQFNWGHYSNPDVDRAFDAMRGAASDPEYQRGVAAYARAIVDDPPAIFLAWSERTRAVSTRYTVPAEPGRDVLSTLRQWRTAGAAPGTH